MWPRILIASLLAATACVAPATTTCDDGGLCPAGLACAPTGGCVDPAQLAACAALTPGAACTLPGIGAGQCRDGVCVVARCGDGVRDPDEGCDDGNRDDDDDCTNACAVPSCGDGVRQGTEACDDGAANGDDRACLPTCVAARCGDGRRWAGHEACDAGVANDDAGVCTSSCADATCGDGLLWAGVEACDDGNLASADGCRADCGKVEACGDALVDAGEACDDGNGNPFDGCAACGDQGWSVTAAIAGQTDPATLALAFAEDVATGPTGDIVIADTGHHQVLRIDTAGVASVVAGTGVGFVSADGGLAASTPLLSPKGVALDGRGDVYIVESATHRVRRVDHATGRIETIAGTGTAGVAGDGGAATAAQLRTPTRVAVDGLGNVYIADTGNHRVRRVDQATGIITTFAGTGATAFNGDGQPATSATLRSPGGLALGPAGEVWIADTQHERVRQVDANGVITTIAGIGVNGSTGDGGPATAASLTSPYGITRDAAGVLYIADTFGQRIRAIALDGTISTVAGDGLIGAGTDGVAGPASRLSFPTAVTARPDGTVWFTDAGNSRVRALDAAGVVATTVARAPAATGALTTRRLTGAAVAVDLSDDAVLVATDAQVLRVDLAQGRAETLAGTQVAGSGGLGGPATAAQLGAISDLAVAASGDVYMADPNFNRVVRWNASDATLALVAGTGAMGYAGDGGDATAARLNGPSGVAVDDAGNVYIADTNNQVVRRVDPGGKISTYAGTTAPGDSGDGGPAANAALTFPGDLAVYAGALYILDRYSVRVRRVDLATAIITTFAGNGVPGGGGDGGPATAASFQHLASIAFTPAGDAYLADRVDARVRKIDAITGLVSTVLGDQTRVRDGDGGPAVLARTNDPAALAFTSVGDLLVYELDALRRIDHATGEATTIIGAIDPLGMGPASGARAATPVALAAMPDATLLAGGSSGVLQALGDTTDELSVVAGRYPQASAIADRARYRGAGYGTMGGVAVDATAGRIYLSDSTAGRIDVIAMVDPATPATWTLTPLTGTAGPGLQDGALATARFRNPAGLFVDAASRTLLVADAGNHVIREIDLDAAMVRTVAGTPATLGYFGDGLAATEALLFAPQAVVRCAPTGDLFVADTGNHRVRRIDAAGTITTVLGDGVAASSGQGAPAWSFPVDSPRGLACDEMGNLAVTSTTAVRLLPAAVALDATSGDVDGSGIVQTIYGAAPRDAFPASATSCLAGVMSLGAGAWRLSDSCAGIVVDLTASPTP